MKRSRFITVLVLSALMFGVVQPVFADERSTKEVAAETAIGAVLGAIAGGALVFFTGGAALPFVVGGAALGAAAGAADKETREKIVDTTKTPPVIEENQQPNI